MNKQEDKEKQLEQLYELRACLSVISQKYDLLIEEEKKLQDRLTDEEVDNIINKLHETNKEVYSTLKLRASDLYAKLKRKSRIFFRFSRKKLPPLVRDSSIFWLLASISERFYIILIRFLLDIVTFPFILFNPARIKCSKMVKAIKRDSNFTNIIDTKIKGFVDNKEIEEFDKECIEEFVKFFNVCEYHFDKYDNVEFKNKGTKFRIFMPSTIQFYYDTSRKSLEERRIEGHKEVKNYGEEQSIKELGFKLYNDCNTIREVMDKYFDTTVKIQNWANIDLIIYYIEQGLSKDLESAVDMVNKEKDIKGNLNAGIEENVRCSSKDIEKSIKAKINEVLLEEPIWLDELNGIITYNELKEALLSKAGVSSVDLIKNHNDLNSKVLEI
ncbi:MAG: hypothetical protein HDT29_04825 [Clostridiales bacterium]|nr:hypothetical protein [Clostridiales bacterium]